MFIWKRKRKLKDGTIHVDITYSYRFEWKGKAVPRKTPFTSYAEAERAGRSHLHALQVGAYDIANALRQRRGTLAVPLAALAAAYRAAPPAPRRANQRTRAANVGALRLLLRTAGAGEMDVLGADALTDALVWKFRDAVEKNAAIAADEERRQQLYRSANSMLRQARSLFSKDFLEYYTRSTAFKLPDLAKFLGAAGFRGVTKTEYNPPPDSIITKTFVALEQLIGESSAAAATADARNMYIACWLALGFGLRASEIARARRNWFVAIDGAVWCAGPELAKNKKFPRVRVQLGAWEKLAPHLSTLAGEAYVLEGHITERTGTVFRRISEWMRNLGWQTQHHVHELRAYAGSHIADHSPRGLLDAQEFLRHAHYNTTEKHYGHHRRRCLAEVKLQLPAAAGPVTLTLLQGGQK